MSVRSFLPPHATKPRNIGTYVFTATRKTILFTRNRSLSNIGRARCAAINSDFLKIIISKYINYTIGINDNNCVFVCNLILGW